MALVLEPGLSIRRRSIPAWIAYGMGSSGYLLMVPAIGFATYFRSHVMQGRADADLIWGITVACALVAAGISGPFLGAFADQTGTRRHLIAIATTASLVFTAALSLVAKGDVLFGALLFIGAHTSFLLAKAVYDSYLPLLGEPASLSQISGTAWGLGYIGSLVCFLLCLPLIRGGTEHSDPAVFRMSFAVTAVFFGMLALPALLWFPSERPTKSPGNRISPLAQVAGTLRGWRNHREIFKFLLAYYLINDAIVTVLLFIGIYMQATFGLSVERILQLTLLFYAFGIPSTAAFGWLGRNWSERGALYVSLAIWLGLLALLALGRGAGVPIIIVCVAGLVIGSTQALCRSIYARMIPPERSAEFFGFNAFVGRASAALAPLAFGLVASATGSQRIAMASLAVFFVAGGIVLAFVRLEKVSDTAAIGGRR